MAIGLIIHRKRPFTWWLLVGLLPDGRRLLVHLRLSGWDYGSVPGRGLDRRGPPDQQTCEAEPTRCREAWKGRTVTGLHRGEFPTSQHSSGAPTGPSGRDGPVHGVGADHCQLGCCHAHGHRADRLRPVQPGLHGHHDGGRGQTAHDLREELPAALVTRRQPDRLRPRGASGSPGHLGDAGKRHRQDAGHPSTGATPPSPRGPPMQSGSRWRERHPAATTTRCTTPSTRSVLHPRCCSGAEFDVVPSPEP